jgi:hypothetical protein
MIKSTFAPFILSPVKGKEKQVLFSFCMKDVSEVVCPLLEVLTTNIVFLKRNVRSQHRGEVHQSAVVGFSRGAVHVIYS